MRSPTPAGQLRRLYLKHKGLCAYCGRKTILMRKDTLPTSMGQQSYWARATRDHILPRVLGGSNRMSNLVLSCYRCNHIKAEKYEPKHKRVKAIPGNFATNEELYERMRPAALEMLSTNEMSDSTSAERK